MKEYKLLSNEFKICHGPTCNARPDLPKCILCSSANDENCARNVSQNYTQVCGDYESFCYTYIGSHITRGCIKMSDEKFRHDCAMRHDKCDLCVTGMGLPCNDRNFNVQRCIECDSAKDPRCKSNPEALVSFEICNRFRASPLMVNTGCYLNIVSIFEINHKVVCRFLF